MEEDPDRFHLGGLENIDRAGNVVIQGSKDKFTYMHRTSTFITYLKNVPRSKLLKWDKIGK